MKQGMLNILYAAPMVRENVFFDKITESEFIEFVFSNILLLFAQQKENCDTLTEVIRRMIYED